MLQTTTELIAYLQQDKSKRNFNVIGAMVHAIVCCGSNADASALLPVFLSNAGSTDHAMLLPVLEQYGDKHTAEEIFKACSAGQRLNQGVEERVLEVLGKLGYEPAKPMLVYYALEQEPYDYYLNMYAVLGLLHLELTDLAPAMLSSIEKCYGQSLFPEFVPALVGKLPPGQQPAVLQKLYELGQTTASTDCLGGIVLGFSLSGAAGEAYFWKALFNPFWEMSMTGTGLRHHTYTALSNLGITFKQVYQKIKELEEGPAQQYGLETMLALLEQKVDEPLNLNSTETVTEIYTTLFGWKNSSESNNLTDLAEKLDVKEEADHIERLLELKMKEEMILKNLWALKGKRDV